MMDADSSNGIDFKDVEDKWSNEGNVVINGIYIDKE